MNIYPHNENSAGASALAKALEIRRIRHDNSTFRGAPGKLVINWGASELPEEILKCRVLNNPDAVRESSDKLSFFRKMEGKVRIPEFTTDPETAKQWVREGNTVVARTMLRASSGRGLFLMSSEKPNSFRQAPLYTKYIKKKDEYRVHFCSGKIIDIQRKALQPNLSPELVNWQIRNLDNGFIFVRNNVELPKDAREQAEKVIEHGGLDFGAIDLIFNEKEAKAYVLEVNTAPGLVGTTVENYANAFREYTK